MDTGGLNPGDLDGLEENITPDLLDQLYLGLLKGIPEVAGNSIFVTLRSKLVAFYKKYDLYKTSQDLTQFDLSDPPTKSELDKLQKKYVLMKSLKKLLRVAIVTHDPEMRLKHLHRLY